MAEASSAGTQSGQRILDAASILLVDRTRRDAPRLLMGLRRADNVFLPNKWVFPGGRLEAGDVAGAAATDVNANDAEPLRYRVMHDDPENLPRALAHAAVRELYEETGHALAVRRETAPAMPGGGPAGLLALGLAATLAPLRFIARAITPPGRPRRYDTRFFVASRLDVIEGAGPADGEFSDISWFTFTEARRLDLPNITQRVLCDLETLLAGPSGAAFGPIPFYYQDGDAYRRDLIPRTGSLPAA